ncbi:MAG: DJ-1/PfpI family protein [Ruminococcaceae bacterium]|nr:DJ-1/PfpI family protein [Oscillospiraceae bacterium]
MIAVFLADGFEEIEALAVVDILRRANLDVKTITVDTVMPVGAHEINVLCELLDEELEDLSDITAVVLPGGMPGTLNLEQSDIVQDALRYAMEHNLPIGAICAAPSILGHAGYLQGKKATCYPGFESELTGAILVEDSIVTDGNITTGCGPGVAIDFALELVRVLASAEKAEEIRRGMQCR